MNKQVSHWRRQDLAKAFLDDVRGGIPLAAEQIDMLRRVVRHAVPKVERFLDLGCGNGILGQVVLADFPESEGVFVDLSDYMIETAQRKIDSARAAFVVQDFASNHWTQSVDAHAPFDLVLSGLAIHHLVDERKQELYHEIFGLLRPGGLFLNLESVALRSPWSEQAYDELFVDSLWSYRANRGDTPSRDAIAEDWQRRPGKAKDIPATVEDQCRWLRECGFVDVDCFFKAFALALFGGRKAP
jgi:SAM-dependent methyltransferase